MAWLRIELDEEERRVVNAERDGHPDAPVRRKMLVLWMLHCGVTREKAAEVAGLGRATVQRYVAAYRRGGLDGLRRWGVAGPVSDLAAHAEAIKRSLSESPVPTIAQACERIESLTGLRRGPTQVRKFLAARGFKWRMVRPVPVPPKKTWRSTPRGRSGSWTRS
jgi:transposase